MMRADYYTVQQRLHLADGDVVPMACVVGADERTPAHRKARCVALLAKYDLAVRADECVDGVVKCSVSR